MEHTVQKIMASRKEQVQEAR